MNSAPMMARGSARCGSFTSSPAVATASNPMKEKKIAPAAALMPAAPYWKKLAKWSASQAVIAMIENRIRTPTLISTMIVLTLADSDAPRSSRNMHISTSTTAGRLMMPPVASPSKPGTNETDNAVGSSNPNRFCSSLLK